MGCQTITKREKPHSPSYPQPIPQDLVFGIDGIGASNVGCQIIGYSFEIKNSNREHWRRFKRITPPIPSVWKNTQRHWSQIVILSSTSTDDRQKANIGTLTQTDIQIQLSFRLKPLAQNEDVDNAMDLENDIIISICNRGDTALYQNVHFKFVSCSCVLVDSGEYILSSINFESLHYLPLQ